MTKVYIVSDLSSEHKGEIIIGAYDTIQSAKVALADYVLEHPVDSASLSLDEIELEGEVVPSRQFVRHYKGEMYEVLGYAEHTEGDGMHVIYLDAFNKKWIRPLDMFEGAVEVDGIFFPRFEHVDELGNVVELDELINKGEMK